MITTSVRGVPRRQWSAGDLGRRAPRSDLRASSSDREHVLADLDLHHEAGRLDDELEARVDAVFRARTLADLSALTADLPSVPSTRGIVVAMTAVSVATLVTAVATLTVWSATGGHFWPAYPIGGTASALVPLEIVRRVVEAARTR